MHGRLGGGGGGGGGDGGGSGVGLNNDFRSSNFLSSRSILILIIIKSRRPRCCVVSRLFSEGAKLIPIRQSSFHCLIINYSENRLARYDAYNNDCCAIRVNKYVRAFGTHTHTHFVYIN